MRETMTYSQAALILKIDPASITKDELKKAYVALARENHPDYNKKADANKVMGQINEAYATLKNEVPIKGYRPEYKPKQEESTSNNFEDMAEMIRRMRAERMRGRTFDFEGFDFYKTSVKPEPTMFKGVDPDTGEAKAYKTQQAADLSHQLWAAKQAQNYTWIDPTFSRKDEERRKAQQSKYNVPPPKQEQMGKWKRSAKGNLYREAPKKPNLHRWIIMPDKFAAKGHYCVLEIIEGEGLNMSVNHDQKFSTEEGAIIYVDELIARIHKI